MRLEEAIARAEGRYATYLKIVSRLEAAGRDARLVLGMLHLAEEQLASLRETAATAAVGHPEGPSRLSPQSRH